ncbi:TonB-dependent receptor, partial [candidate division KSB1 bacterium]|nr:TonB-dependent receptor [candidate division KSB1 bacterium]
ARYLRGASRATSILYMPGYFSPSDIYRNIFGVQFTHMLSPKTFYEISLQKNINRYKTYQMDDRDTSRVYQPIPGYFVDEAPYGYYGYGVNGIDGLSMGGWMNLGRDRSVNSTTSFRFDLTSQVNARNQVKVGLHVSYNDYRINSSTYSPSMSTWTREMKYNVFPYRIGLYVQDKVEFQGFIGNLGVRLDYSDPNGTYLVMSNYDQNLGAGYGKTIESAVTKQTADAELYVSPRLGVSHPITANSKLYFNYGHFRSEPYSSYRFRLQRESNGLVTYLGNPNMTMEKTVAYELGYSQNLLNLMLLNVAAYYKDVSDQPGWIYYENINGTVKYYKAENNNYADIRGFEVTLSKTVGDWITGFVNYTYDVSTSGYFGLQRYFQDINKQRDYLRLNPYQSKPHPIPYARLNLDLHTPESFGPTLYGVHPAGAWNINILADWRAGSYETYNPNSIPGVVDNIRWKDWYNLDLRISKLVRIDRVQVQVYLDISNVLNTKHLSSAGFSDTYDYTYYLESLCFDWEEGDQHGNDRVGDLRPDHVAYNPLEANPDNDPQISARNKERKKSKSYIDNPNIEAFRFLNPRDVIFGIKVNF